jgi:hypothetical protein
MQYLRSYLTYQGQRRRVRQLSHRCQQRTITITEIRELFTLLHTDARLSEVNGDLTFDKLNDIGAHLYRQKEHEPTHQLAIAA